jgi:hypothetical protein
MTRWMNVAAPVQRPNSTMPSYGGPKWSIACPSNVNLILENRSRAPPVMSTRTGDPENSFIWRGRRADVFV